MTWTVHFHDKAELEFRALPIALKARVARLIETMIAFGPNLGMPHSKALGSGLFEIRAKSVEGIARALYVGAEQQSLVILLVIVKKSDKLPLRTLALAKKRRKELKL
jgi:phage-related protein